jgi:hypothetical protein
MLHGIGQVSVILRLTFPIWSGITIQKRIQLIMMFELSRLWALYIRKYVKECESCIQVL